MSEDNARPRRTKKAPPPVAILLAGVWFLCIVAGLAVLIIVVESMRETLVAAALVILAVMPAAIAAAIAADATRKTEHRLTRLSHHLDEILGELRLSDGARSVLYRKEERELLRRAIEQDMADNDWDSAHALVKRLAEVYGHRHEAEDIRERIDNERAHKLDRMVQDALDAFERFLHERHWPEAYAEAARIQRLFPDSPRIIGLRERVDNARVVHRRDLERRFLNAAHGDDPVEAFTLLKELDAYLTPGDAPRFEEAARGVIARARETLGTQFKDAVRDHRWLQAVTLGERLMRDFPNTRMAEEVQSLMPSIRERVADDAGQPARG